MSPEDFPRFRLFLPAQAVGASVIHWDLFNRTDTGCKLAVWNIIPIVDGSTINTGVLGINLFLNRTTAVGTTGTAATRNGTTFTAATFACMEDPGANLPGGITARLTPGGGATAGTVISYVSLFGEETSPAAYTGQLNDFVRRNLADLGPLFVKPGSGISVVQGAVAATGTIAYDVIFSLMPFTA